MPAQERTDERWNKLFILPFVHLSSIHWSVVTHDVWLSSYVSLRLVDPSFSFPSLHPWFLSYLFCIPYFYCPSLPLPSSHLFISPIAIDLFQSTRFPIFFSSLPAPLSLIPSLQFPCPSHSFVSFPSLLISFPCCLSSLACTAVAASQAIKQWEFSTPQMCWWMGGRVEKVEGGQRTGWMLGGARTTYTCLFQVRNVTEHCFF